MDTSLKHICWGLNLVSTHDCNGAMKGSGNGKHYFHMMSCKDSRPMMMRVGVKTT